MPEPSFRRGSREVSGKAAPPLGPPWPAVIKDPCALRAPVRGEHLCALVLLPAFLHSRAMASAGALPALPLLLALLGALRPGPGDAQTAVFPTEAILPRGDSVLLNCSSSCNETATLGLETPLTKIERDIGHNWKMFELSDVQEDSRPLCFSNCGEKQTSASISITVFWFPERVELTPLPPWQPVGEDLTLQCLAWGGAPRAQLTLVLLRGEEELSRQPAVGEPAEVTATVLAGRGDYGANFTCRAELDLRPRGLELFQNTSAPQQLRTFDLPTTSPQLTSPRILEVGTVQRVVCSMDGLFPALEAQVHLALGDQRLNTTVTYNKDSLSATALVEGTAEQEGDQPLVCAVLLGNQSRQSRRTLTVYSFPAPNLTLTEQEVSEGTQVLVVCEAYAGNVVRLSGVPPGLRAPRAQSLLNATAEDNGLQLSCSAALTVAGQVLYKNQTQELHVLYGPRLDKKDCLGNWTWPEGTQQELECRAWGNPVPQLTCRRETDGALLPIGPLRPVKEHEGTYVCWAVSSRGKVTRKVFLKVCSRNSTNMIVIILVMVVAILSTVVTATYLYNRQRKIKIYKLQKAQEEASMKLNTQATPP
ncbi:intercellular adhesion molecule 1 isoform X2 [Sciurus carolinensis]|uniref:intercellular adhesion molecule 1 isoform X2 n=1 Tax=Sciurus carolinensis TaxID=30640 RepID=UPI001FB4E41E|nr:intercellular adhesion molecule 1 isoform X2 [Sciurus carolinensis]